MHTCIYSFMQLKQFVCFFFTAATKKPVGLKNQKGKNINAVKFVYLCFHKLEIRPLYDHVKASKNAVCPVIKLRKHSPVKMLCCLKVLPLVAFCLTLAHFRTWYPCCTVASKRKMSDKVLQMELCTNKHAHTHTHTRGHIQHSK